MIKMKGGLTYFIAGTLVLATPSCKNSQNETPQSPQQLEKLIQTSQSTETIRCYFNQNDNISYGSINLSNRTILISFPINKSEETIVHGYIKQKENSFAEVYPIKNNEKDKIEKQIRDLGYQGKISFWQLP